MDLYRKLIIDHYKHPQNFGHLKHPTGAATLSNTSCGDQVTMKVELIKKDGKITIGDIRFSGVGCAISLAAASLLTEQVKGKKVQEVQSYKGDMMRKMIGVALTPSRVKCATLPLEVLQKALEGVLKD